MINSKFITDILKLLLDGDKEGLMSKSQLDYLTELDYDYTDSGFYLSFKHQNGIKNHRTDKMDLVLNGVKIESNQLTSEADVTLFFKNGLIDYLEIWSNDNNYPRYELTNYKLTQNWKDSSKKKIITE